MSEPSLPRLGDRNAITLSRYFDYDGVHYLPFDEVEVDACTARYLIENNYGQLTSIERGAKTRTNYSTNYETTRRS